MSVWSGVAVYFIIWWVVLFAVLPWGVQNAHEAGETVESGNEPGAPVNPRLLLKTIVTTLISAAIFAIVYAVIVSGWLLGSGQ
jgi:predicted secreted protein